MMPAFRFWRAACFLSATAVASVSAATYYVAPTGDDANPGSVERPFRTVQRGADALNPGDTLLLREGVYAEVVAITRSGTPDQRIVIAGHPGEQAVIDGRMVLPRGLRSVKRTNYLALVHVTASHLELRDLTVRNSRGRGLLVGNGLGYLNGGTTPTTEVLVRNVRVSGTWGTGLSALGSDRVTFENCEAWDCVLSNAPPRRGVANWAATMGAADATHTTFRHCTARNGHGEGIFDLRSEHTLIEDCVSYDHYKIIMYLDNSRFSTVRRNVLLSTDDRTFWRYGTRPTPGFSLNNEPYPRQNFGAGQRIHHNLVFNTGTGISIWHFGVAGSSYTDSEISHNAFVSTRPATESGYGLGINSEGSHDIRFHRNVIRFPAGRVANGTTRGWEYANNAWSEPPPEAFTGKGDVIAGEPVDAMRDGTLLRLPAPTATAADPSRALVNAVRRGKFDLHGAGLAPRSDVPSAPAGVTNPLGAELEVAPLPADTPASAQERRRGFTDAELAAARLLVPLMPDVPVMPAKPRTVTVEGRVFLDLNGNQQPDKAEPGLAGVVVSDGERTARTDAEGKYTFTFAIGDEPHHRFVFAVQPDAHASSGPWHFLIPAGDDQDEYRANFAFVPQPDAAGVEVLIAGAINLGDAADMLGAAKRRAAIAAEGPATAIVAPGGLTRNGSSWEFDLLDRVQRAAKIPVRAAFGAADGTRAGSTICFEERAGPPWCSWDAGGVHFVQLVASVEHLAPGARARQERWLAADLANLPPAKPVVIVAHTPFDSSWIAARRNEGANIVAQIVGRAGKAPGAGVPVFAAEAGDYRRVRVSGGSIVPTPVP